jgi:CheY-like chemotaxis protein
MKILLVEDNRPFGEEIAEYLTRFVGSPWWVRTESDFREHFEAIATDLPDVAVVDLMLRWDVLRREGPRPRPPDTDMYLGGVRCALLLAGDTRTRDMPVILYTVVEQEDIDNVLANCPPSVHYLQKSSDLSKLVELIRELTAPSRHDSQQ